MEIFERARLRVGRELAGLTQTQLANQVGLTPAAVSQFEGGTSRPTQETAGRLADALGVPADFFAQPMSETHEGFFRSLRKTAVADRRRARAIAQVVHDMAVGASQAEMFSECRLPRLAASGLDAPRSEVEDIATKVRSDWHMPSGPIPDMVSLLEAHGIAVTRLPLSTTDVDAFSLPFSDHPVVMLATEKGDRARSRFDAAHELGHLVMHGEEIWGMKETEDQAHAFAASFLMPEQEIGKRLPSSLDWGVLMDLKREWQVSMAALLIRAKHLEIMSPATYLAGVKAMSARGWRRREPVYLGPPETPTALITYLSSSASEPTTKSLPSNLVSQILTAAATD